MAYLDLTRPDHAYLFGFLQADGHHSAGAGQKGRVQIEVSKRDAALLRAFVVMLPVYSSITYRTRSTNFATTHSSTTWTVCDLAFRRELVQLGLPVGRKSHIVKPPTVQFSARDYLRGLIDADGSIGFTATGYPFISFVSASQPLAEFFCDQVLLVTGAHRSLKRNTRDNVYGPMVASDPAAVLATWLYPEGCIAIERKCHAAQAVATWTRPVGMRARPEPRRRWTSLEDAVVTTMPVQQAATRLGRTVSSVSMRRWRLQNATGL